MTSTTRTITGVDLGVRPAADVGLQLTEHERIVELELRGDGFLRHMVRAIAGTLLEVGYGRRAPDDIDAPARRRAPRATPARPRPRTDSRSSTSTIDHDRGAWRTREKGQGTSQKGTQK